MKLGKLKIVFLLALLWRFSMIFSAYHGDINNNVSWAKNAAEFGLNGFYEREGWEFSHPNQPPGTIYFFWVAGKTYQIIERVSWWLNTNVRLFPSPFIWWWEQNGRWGLVKISSILADLGIGWLIYNYVKNIKGKWALPLASFYLFNPVSWYNSAYWGQTDALVNFIGLIGLICLIRGRMILAIVFLALSLFVKASLFPFLPVFVAVAFWQKGYKKLVLGILVALGILGILSLPFHPKANVFPWLVELYRQQILPGETGTLTVNAFNFWAILAGKKFILDSVTFLGLQVKIWGFLIFSLMLVRLLMVLKGDLSGKRIIFTLALASFASFLFLTRMHERYLFPIFPLMTLLLVFLPRLLPFYLPLSLTHLLNLYSEWWQPGIGWLKAVVIREFFVKSIGFLNLLFFFVLLAVFIFRIQWVEKKFWRWA